MRLTPGNADHVPFSRIRIHCIQQYLQAAQIAVGRLTKWTSFTLNVIRT